MKRLLRAMVWMGAGCCGLAGATQAQAAVEAKATVDAQATVEAKAAMEVTAPVAMDARVRIFGQANIDVRFYRNQACYSGKGVIASKPSGLGSLFGGPKNLSLGMPVTPAVATMKERDTFLNNVYFREYALYPGDPVTIRATFMALPAKVSHSCDMPAVSFVPQKGADYEVQTHFGTDACRLTVSRIDASEGSVKMLPVEVVSTFDCTTGK